jgi:tetratricopeptide (TPR) repeat protein
LQEWAVKGRRSAVLVTSRSLLPSGVAIELGGLSDAEGLVFFDRLGVTGEYRSALIKLAKGHPLLLKLAASWTIETYDSRVDDRAIDFFDKLFTNYTGDPKAGVAAIFSVIFEALPLALQELLCRVSVYRLPIDAAMSQAMQPHIKSLQEETLKNFNIDLQKTFLEATKTALQALCDWGLLLSQDDRFLLHPLVAGLVRSKVTEVQQREAHEGAIGYYEANYQDWDGTIKSCRSELEGFYHACELGEYDRAYRILDRCYVILNLASEWRLILPLNERLKNEWKTNDIAEVKTLGWVGIRINNLHYRLGDYPAAIEVCIQVQKTFEQLDYVEGLAAIFCSLGNAYHSLCDYQKAIEFHSQHYELSQKNNDKFEAMSALMHLGMAHRMIGDYQKSFEYHYQSLNLAKEINNKQGIANVISSLGTLHRSVGDYPKALEMHLQHRELAQSISDSYGVSLSIGNLATVYYYLGDYQKSLELNFQYNDLAEAVGDRRGVVQSLSNIGSAYTGLGEHQKAIGVQFQAIKLAQSIGSVGDVARSLGNIGVSYNFLGKYQEALKFHYQHYELAQKIDEKPSLLISLRNIGSSYYSLRKYEQSINYYYRLFELSKLLEDKQEIINSLDCLGNNYEALSEHLAALRFYEQCLEYSQSSKDKKDVVNSLCKIGNTHHFLSNYYKAIDFHSQCLHLSQSIGATQGIASSLGNLGNAYHSLGNYQKAIEFYKLQYKAAYEINDVKGKSNSLRGEANSLWNLSNIYQQRGHLKCSIHYRHQAYRIWQDTNLLLADAPFPAWTKKLYQSMDDNWAEQLIATENSMAWLMLPIGYLLFALRILLSPLTQLQTRLKIQPKIFWFCVGITIVLLIAWLKK